MSYWQIRFAIYQQSLKNWLDSIKQVSTAIIALFPLALMALLLLPLLALGILSDANAESRLYFLTLWGYLLLSYTWVAMQKEAINATEYSDYDTMLPASKRVRLLTHYALLLYASHVFIAGPFVVLLAMLLGNAQQLAQVPLTVSAYNLTPVAALLVLAVYYCQSATGGRLPWLSLGLIPFLGLVAAPSFSSPHIWLAIWTVGIVVEKLIKVSKAPSLPLPMGLWRVYWQKDLHYPKGSGLRAVAVLLVAVLAKVFIDNVDGKVENAVAYVFAVVLGILLATKLLEVVACNKEYQYYLSGFEQSRAVQILQILAYCAVFSCVGVLVIVNFKLFNSDSWAVLGVVYLGTQIGILYKPNYYLVFSLASAVLAMGYLVPF